MTHHFLAATLMGLLLLNPPSAIGATPAVCSQDSITLKTQAAVDNFQANFGPCDTVTGSLEIDSFDSIADPIHNLDGLSALTYVGTSLSIEYNTSLTSLGGLSSLSSVGSYLLVGWNRSLTNLDGLSSLTSVGSYIHIQGNGVLTSLDGLSSLPGTRTDLRIRNNNALTSLEGLSSWTRLGALWIEDNDALTNLDGLSSLTSVEAHIRIDVNESLTNLDGLSSLTSVGEFLQIDDNDALTNLDGLSALRSVGTHLTVMFNDGLEDCSGLAQVLGWPTIPHDWDSDFVGGVTWIDTFVDGLRFRGPDHCLNAYVEHSLGGTVSGLDGAEILLRNNGEDELLISQDGAFEFSTGLFVGSAYEVTVANQPSGQECIVLNGVGKMPSRPFSSVLVQCTYLPIFVDGFDEQ